MLHNLLGNAIKYSPDGGAVRVRITADVNAVQVVIEDSGIGIPMADLPHIFECFYRAGNVGAGTISGMGMGLFVAQEIATLHRGTITVTSAEGLESSFTLALARIATPQGVR